VTLPHTVASLSWQRWEPSAWERLWVYRKHFDAPPGTDGMRVFLDFAAAMTRATVTLNGGVVDLFRIPKPGAAIYQAQADPGIAPVIAPAFYWDFGPVSPVTSLPEAMICVNLDRLEVYVGGEHFATLTPDTARYPGLDYPPSFADFSTVDGSSLPELRIDGYLGSVRVASRSLACDPSGDVLALTADDAEIDGDGVDATRLAFRAVDRYGAPRPYVTGQVTLEVEGPAVLIGDNPFDFAATAGAGAVWIRSRPGSRGTVTVRASHPSLGSAVASIRVREVRETGSPGRAVSSARWGGR
jgi:beta-galactosidase